MTGGCECDMHISTAVRCDCMTGGCESNVTSTAVCCDCMTGGCERDIHISTAVYCDCMTGGCERDMHISTAARCDCMTGGCERDAAPEGGAGSGRLGHDDSALPGAGPHRPPVWASQQPGGSQTAGDGCCGPSDLHCYEILGNEFFVCTYVCVWGVFRLRGMCVCLWGFVVFASLWEFFLCIIAKFIINSLELNFIELCEVDTFTVHDFLWSNLYGPCDPNKLQIAILHNNGNAHLQVKFLFRFLLM